MTAVRDFDQLKRDLEQRRVLLGLTALFVVVGLAIAATGIAFHFPLWVVAMLPVLGAILLATAIFGGKSFRIHQEAWDRLQEIVHEEWRTHQRILPPDFPVGRWYGLFRTPPNLSEKDLRGLRRVEWLRGRQFTMLWAVWAAVTLIILPGSLIGVRYFGLPGWWAVVAFLGLLPTFTGGLFWASKDSSLLYHLREYERITGTRILPPDLSKMA